MSNSNDDSGPWDSGIPCGICGTATLNTDTKRCDRCWELERYINASPELARAILGHAPVLHNHDQAITAQLSEISRAQTNLQESLIKTRQYVNKHLVRQCMSGKGDPPMDCGAPYCGCDPAWREMMECLNQDGWIDGSQKDALIDHIHKQMSINHFQHGAKSDWPLVAALRDMKHRTGKLHSEVVPIEWLEGTEPIAK